MHRVVVPRVFALFQRHSSISIGIGSRLANSRKISTMATPYKVHITPENTGLFKAAQKLTPEAAGQVSQLLQEDLEVSYTLQHHYDEPLH